MFSSRAQSLYFPPLTGTLWDTVSPATLGWCNAKVDSLLNYLGEKNTKAFIILKEGKIVIEKYYGTFTQDSLWYWASAGKTLTAFTTGIAQQENHLKITDTVSKHIGAGWTSCTTVQEEKITIKHLLTMTSGLNDTVPDIYCTTPACLKYLADAGTRWAYHTGAYTVLDSIIFSATGQTINNYINQKIKPGTGITGSFFKSGYNNVFASNARSMARFGLLLLNKGTWSSTPIMTDTNYFHQMVNTSQSLNKSYGYLTWLNGKQSYMVPQSQYVLNGALNPDALSDMFAAFGKNGQFINVVPSQHIVFIRMGNIPVSGEVPFTFNDSIWQKLNNMTCPTTAINTIETNTFKLYPNPTSGKFHIELPQNNFNICIQDISGRIVFEQENCSDKTEIDVQLFCKGIYFIQIKVDDKLMAVQKLVKNE